MPDQSLLEKLKQRKVVQWSLAYVAAAWVVAQVVEIVAGPWNIPAGWIRVMHVALAGGLPITAILSWFHGARGGQRVRSAEVAALVTVIAATGLAFLVLDPVADRNTSGPADALGTHGRLATIAEAVPRLAVVAFTNIGSPDDSYFADGITNELNSRLSGLRGLAVLSRSSANMYRDSGRTVREIGRALGADYVLHGTVQWDRSADRGTSVRVVPEIIRVNDDTQIWSTPYDRPFEDALSIQSEIASKVVAELDLALSDSERTTIESPPTANPLAYETYLKGIQVLPQGHGSERDFEKARTLALQAVTLDPDFALAWTLLAEADMGIYWFGYDTLPGRLEQAVEAIQSALSLNPALPEATMAMGDYHYRLRDWDAALAEFSKVYTTRPNDSDIIKRLGYIWRRLGMFSEAADALGQACDLDPLNAYDKLEYAWTQVYLGEYEEAEDLVRLARETDPTEEWTYLIGAALYWSRDEDGDLERARKMLDHFPEPRAAYPAYNNIVQDLYEGELESALRRVRDLAEPVLVLQAAYIPAALAEGLVLQTMRRNDEARSAFEKARIQLEQEFERNPDDFRLPIALGQTYAGLGLHEDALRQADAVVELMPLESDALLGTDALYGQMEIYAMLGETELALDTMTKLVSTPTHLRGAYFTRNPVFAALREEPRFWDLLEE